MPILDRQPGCKPLSGTVIIAGTIAVTVAVIGGITIAVTASAPVAVPVAAPFAVPATVSASTSASVSVVGQSKWRSISDTVTPHPASPLKLRMRIRRRILSLAPTSAVELYTAS